MLTPRHARDNPLAASIVAGPIAFDFDSTAATVIALAFGAGAAVLAVGPAWPTGIVRVIPPFLHGYADVIMTVALILLRVVGAENGSCPPPLYATTRARPHTPGDAILRAFTRSC